MAGAVAVLSILLPFALRWLHGALERNAIERVIARRAPLLSAIARYHDERGRPPGALSDLVPGYLNSIPSTGIGVCPRFLYRQSIQSVIWYDLGLHNNDLTSSQRRHGTMGHPSHAYLVLHLGADHRVQRIEVERLPRYAQYHLYDSDRWQREPRSRAGMTRNLVASGTLKGRSATEITHLLGKATGSKRFNRRPWELNVDWYPLIHRRGGDLTVRGESPGRR